MRLAAAQQAASQRGSCLAEQQRELKQVNSRGMSASLVGTRGILPGLMVDKVVCWSHMPI